MFDHTDQLLKWNEIRWNWTLITNYWEWYSIYHFDRNPTGYCQSRTQALQKKAKIEPTNSPTDRIWTHPRSAWGRRSLRIWLRCTEGPADFWWSILFDWCVYGWVSDLDVLSRCQALPIQTANIFERHEHNFLFQPKWDVHSSQLLWICRQLVAYDF